MTKQLAINFTPLIYAGFKTCREFISGKSMVDYMSANNVYQKQIAADMDLSPSHLSRKLSDVGDNRFTLDDLEQYIKVTGDVEPIKYLVSHYLYNSKEDELQTLKARLEELEKSK